MTALADGGVTVAEVTLTVPGALDVIREAKRATRRPRPARRRHRSRPGNRARRSPGRRGVHRRPEPEPRRHHALPPLRQARDARRVHADGGADRVGSGRGHREGVPGGRGRPGVLQGASRTAAAGEADADRRRRSDDRRRVPEGRRGVSGRRRAVGRSEGRRGRRLRPDHGRWRSSTSRSCGHPKEVRWDNRINGIPIILFILWSCQKSSWLTTSSRSAK